MDYVDWVELVARAFADLPKAIGQVSTVEISEAVGVPVESGPASLESSEALWHAIQDLNALTVLTALNTRQISETENTRKLRAGIPLRSLWKSFFQPFLEAEHEQFLAALVRIADAEHDGFADTRWRSAHDVFVDLRWTTEDSAIARAYLLVNVLEENGFIATRRVSGSLTALAVRPTYKGVVRATARPLTEWHERLTSMATEGETVTVDFKRELNLGGERGKAEFIKDVLGLATVKASGRDRFIVIGYDDVALTFSRSADATITQDRLENILNAYVVPPQPSIRYRMVPVATEASAGVIEIRRDPVAIPYRIGKAISRLRPGDVYSRHGTHRAPHA